MYNKGKSIENTYEILSGDTSPFQTMLSYLMYAMIYPGKDLPEDIMPVFFVEPGEIPTYDEIDEMIAYFASKDEFEKCQYLKEFKNKLPESQQ